MDTSDTYRSILLTGLQSAGTTADIAHNVGCGAIHDTVMLPLTYTSHLRIRCPVFFVFNYDVVVTGNCLNVAFLSCPDGGGRGGGGIPSIVIPSHVDVSELEADLVGVHVDRVTDSVSDS